MAIENWTDVDYAQAAIDMLPGSVEEIETMLRNQKIKSRWEKMICPVQRWLERWTDDYASVGWSTVDVEDQELDLPIPVQEFILHVDRKDH